MSHSDIHASYHISRGSLLLELFGRVLNRMDVRMTLVVRGRKFTLHNATQENGTVRADRSRGHTTHALHERRCKHYTILSTHASRLFNKYFASHISTVETCLQTLYISTLQTCLQQVLDGVQNGSVAPSLPPCPGNPGPWQRRSASWPACREPYKTTVH